MQDRPTSSELLAAVRDFIEELLPDLEGRRLFHARVAANVLAIVEREMDAEEEMVREEWMRLVALLGVEDRAPDTLAETKTAVRELSRQLALAIRGGQMDDRWDELMAAVEMTVADKLRVANPAYAEEK
jgi:hypothetical protein